MSAEDLPPRLLRSIREAAILLDRGESTIRAMIRDGEIEAVMVGGSIKIRQSEIERYVADLPRVTPAGR